MEVHFCGVRGSTPAPGPEFVRYGGHTSCLALSTGGGAPVDLLLDVGTGARRVAGLLDGEPFCGTIVCTHLHWDHLQGLPFFSAADRPEATVRLCIPEQDPPAAAFEVLSRAMSPPHFPIDPHGLRGSWSFDVLAPGSHGIGDWEVLARAIPHKGGTTYGLRVSHGPATLAYLPDHCPSALGAGPDGLGELHPAALELADGVDLLVHDAHLVRAELHAEAAFGHAAAEYAVALAERAGARRVALFHHKPGRTDDELDALAASLGSDSVEVIMAAEPMCLRL